MPLSLTRVSRVETSRPDWIWEHGLARGTLTLLEGDPGTSKSTIAYDLAARVSAGHAMPDGSAPSSPGNVWIFSSEDSAARTHATLAASGANLDRIMLVEADDGFRLPSGIGDLQSALADSRPDLIIFDPLSEYLDGSTTSEHAVRTALTPLCKLAETYRFGVLGLRHLRKAQSSNPLYRGGGSIGLVALARSALLVTQNPFQPGQRVLLQFKSSLSPISPAIAFRAVEMNGGLCVDWLGATLHSSEQILASHHSAEPAALEEAVQVLYSLLALGPLPARIVLSRAHENGVSGRTLRRAKGVLGVQSQRHGFGVGSEFWWLLPANDALATRLRDQGLDQLLQSLMLEAERPAAQATAVAIGLPERDEAQQDDWEQWEEGNLGQ